jgi:hypothetical protein
MPNENDRCVVACAIARGDLAHNRVSFSVIVDARVDAVLRDRRGELIHAKRKNIHQAAHQINMGARCGLMGILPRLCLRGSGGTGGANSSSGRACDEATHDRECNCALESARK